MSQYTNTSPKSPPKDTATAAIKQLVELKSLYIQNRYPNFPAHLSPKPKYEDRTANGLTRCVLDFIRFSGGFATRIQSQGQYRPGINGGKGTYTFGTTRKGTADIHAVINGLHFSIEVKIGKDRMSEAQKQMQIDIERAGGHYIVARSFQQFHDWFQTLNSVTSHD